MHSDFHTPEVLAACVKRSATQRSNLVAGLSQSRSSTIEFFLLLSSPSSPSSPRRNTTTPGKEPCVDRFLSPFAHEFRLDILLRPHTCELSIAFFEFVWSQPHWSELFGPSLASVLTL